MIAAAAVNKLADTAAAGLCSMKLFYGTQHAFTAVKGKYTAKFLFYNLIFSFAAFIFINGNQYKAAAVVGHSLYKYSRISCVQSTCFNFGYIYKAVNYFSVI